MQNALRRPFATLSGLPGAGKTTLQKHVLSMGLDMRVVDLEARWHPVFGDRQNELVLIGQEMDEARIRAALEQCLCNEAEIAAWRAGRFPRKDEWPIEVAQPESLEA